MTERGDNFCYNAFTGLDVNQRGSLRPCCKFDLQSMPAFNISDGVEKYTNSKFIKRLQKQFLDNKRPDGCSRCWDDEDAGLESKRQIDYNNNKDFLDALELSKEGYSIVGIAFNNLCNLACRICGPWASSTWVAEERKGAILNWSSNEQTFVDLYENTKDAKLLEIVGGEPFLKNFDEHKEYLKLFVESGQAKDTHIHYVTNGTVFPDETFTNLWKEFEHVDITLSIDDTGKRFEYNRYPANWEEVYSNIKQFQKLSSEEQNIEISLSFTVSAFTIYYAGDFVNWCEAEGLPQPWFGVVSLRDYYHPSVHNDTIKQKIEDKLMLSDNVDVHKLKDFLYKDKSAMDIFNNGDSLFKGYIDRLDKKRGQLFSETFPELVA